MRKTYFVIGLGISGKAATELLLEKGHRVIAVEKDTHLETIQAFQSYFRHMDVDVVSERLALEIFPKIDVHELVVSPGVFADHPIRELAKSNGVPIVGEVEMGIRDLDNYSIGITGTNGKTTLATFCDHLFKCIGMPQWCLGNVGTPICSAALKIQPSDILTLELSSFQLETLKARKFNLATVLNITPDHLNRYDSLKCYAKTKVGIFENLAPDGKLLISKSVWEKYADKSYADCNNVVFFESIINEEVFSLFVEMLEQQIPFENRFCFSKEALAFIFYLKRDRLISDEQVVGAIKTYKRPHHRLEYVDTIDDVSFFNDSKATNLSSVEFALSQIHKKIVLIVGGDSKGASFDEWDSIASDKVKSIYAIGESAKKIQKALKGKCDVHVVSDLEKAVGKGFVTARSGDAVLLSPGCASYDQFEHYEHRGDTFKMLVSQIKKKVTR